MMKVLTVTLHPAIDRIVTTPQLNSGEPNASRLVRMYPAGKGINAARVLHILRVQVFALTFAGQGAMGESLAKNLKQEGIPAFLIPCKSAIRTTTVIVEESTGKRFILYEPRQAVTRAEAGAMFDYFSAIVGNYDLCLLCGAGEGPALEKQYQRMIEQARQKGVPCLLDSSGLSLMNGIMAKPYLVKINRLELAAWAQKEITTFREQLSALKTMIDSGVTVAAVSDAQNGIIGRDEAHVWQAGYTPENVLNTLGSGDAALAGMAYALVHKKNLQEVLRFGVACGAANTQNLGAGFVSRETVLEYQARTEIRLLVD